MSSNVNIPTSIGIIMDGNRRWAKARMLPAKAGHNEGAKAVRRICKAADELGVKNLILYAFSTENWKRDKEEVDAIMKLLEQFLDECIEKIGQENGRVKFLGDRTRLDDIMIEKMNKIERETDSNTGLTVAVAINYGGRDEIIRAIKKMNDDNVDLSKLTEEIVAEYLDTKSIPDPELIIRTSGEERISNFLIWQMAYSEFHFTDKLWPEFNKEDLEKAIEEFGNRNRRFGGK